MAVIAPFAPRASFRFALPPSLGEQRSRARAERLQAFLGQSLGKNAEVRVAVSYESLAKDLLAGRAEAAWAPPFVCARMEAMGIKVLVRGIRHGSSSYRAALVAKAGSGLRLEQLPGSRAAWADPYSTGGHLLAVAHLKAQGLDPSRIFVAQDFLGSYDAALEAVHEGKAQVCSVFCPPSSTGEDFRRGIEEILRGRGPDFDLVCYTDETPNEGICVAMDASEETVQALEKALLELNQSPDGSVFLQEVFNAESFERAPRMGYRSLYRIALSSQGSGPI